MPCRPVFDQDGDLWAGNYGTDTVVEFTRADLATSGSPRPTVTLTSPVFIEPGDVAIDRAGDLWVPTAVNGVLGFTKDQLTKSGSPTPPSTSLGLLRGSIGPGPSPSSRSARVAMVLSSGNGQAIEAGNGPSAPA